MADIASNDTQTSTPPDHGKVFAQWSFPDITLQPRSRRWYVAVGVIGGLMAIYGIWTGNFLFPILLCLFALTFTLVRRQSQTITCVISEDGVAVGPTFYPFRELKKFWIIYQPPDVKNLYLEFRNPLKTRLPVPLESQNPVTIRHLLLDFLFEDVHREEEPALDQISRLLKL